MSKYCTKNEWDIQAMLGLYSLGISNIYEVKDTSRDERDKRFAIFAECKKRGKMVVKAAKNSFSTPRRVEGWAELTEHYNKLDIYAPRFLKGVGGQYGAVFNGYCIWAEEFSKFSNNSILDEMNSEAKLKALGRVASNPAPLLPWSSPYSMFDKFCIHDKAPEIYDNGLNIMRKIRTEYPKYAKRAVLIMKEYESRRAEFEPIYKGLPKASFQADLNESNILYDGEKFAGVMDFNLSGTDAILAYAFYESHYIVEDDEVKGIKQGQNYLDHIEERTRRNLGFIASVYRFSDAERSAFRTFYNLAVPFWNYNFEVYREWLKEDGERAVSHILDYIECHMTRDDIGDWL